MKLSDDDSRAVDMLLDKSMGFGLAAAPAHVRNRLERIEEILSLLNVYTASDPPADLVERTMRRIDRGEPPMQTPLTPGDRPGAGSRPEA